MAQRIRKQRVDPLFSAEREMSIFYELIDWTGGYPYEFTTIDEIKDTGNNEFVFQKEALSTN